MKTFNIGDRVRFRKDDATGTIVRAFRGRMTAIDPTYVVRLDKPDEDGRLRATGGGQIESEDYRDYLAGKTFDPRD